MDEHAGQPTDETQPSIADARQRQYSLTQILLIWAAAAIPMAVLGWGATGVVGDNLDLGVGEDNREAFTRALFLTIGLVWQFVLVLIIVRSEEGGLSRETISRRCWLNTPRDPATGQPRSKLWWWLVPLIIAAGLLQLIPLQDLWEAIFPFLDEPAKYSFAELLDSEERKDDLEGAWQVLVLFIVLGIFNTILGEELLFRGILLPKMSGVFGRRDWVANGLLFGVYHLHQPWGIFNSILTGFVYAWPSRRFRSAWMGIAIHSIETVFFVVIALGLVLGLA
jgi:uncharacterized protein